MNGISEGLVWLGFVPINALAPFVVSSTIFVALHALSGMRAGLGSMLLWSLDVRIEDVQKHVDNYPSAASVALKRTQNLRRVM